MESLQSLVDGLHKAWDSDKRRAVVMFRSPAAVWEENPTFLLLEVAFYVWALLTLKHAFTHGGRYPMLWLAALLHGVVAETLSCFMADIDTYWHSISTVMFEYNRLPLYIVLVYPCFHYTTNVAVARLKLKWWAEPFAVAVSDLLLEFPYDILGVKLLWWTWHDTDANIFDRMYHVPWNNYTIHLSFSWSFTLLLNGSRWLFTGTSDKHKMSNNYFAELASVIITGCLSMPLAILVWFVPFYHYLHDVHGLHTEVVVATVLALYLMAAWTGDRTNSPDSRPTLQSERVGRKKPRFDEIAQVVTIMSCFFIALVWLSDPGSHRSTGPHQPIGDCTLTTYTYAVTGMSFPKHPYICPGNHTEPYYNFACLASLPPNGSEVYTICGSPFPNTVEYRLIVTAACLFNLAFFYNLLFCSGAPPTKPTRPQQKAKRS